MQMSLGLTKALGRQFGSPRGQSRRDGATCVDTLRVLLRRAARHPDPYICQTDVGSDSVGIWKMRGLVSMSLPRTAHGTASQDLGVSSRKHGHPGLVSGPSALAPVQRAQTHTDTACAGPPQEVGDVGHIPPSLPSLGLGSSVKQDHLDGRTAGGVQAVTDVPSQPGCREPDPQGAQWFSRPGTSSPAGVWSFLLSCSDLQQAIRKLSLGNSGRTSRDTNTHEPH